MTDELLRNEFAQHDEQGDAEVPTATLLIYRGIAEALMKRDDTHINRASAATMCVRRRWYQKNGTPGTPLTPRKISNFMLGDLSERVIVHLIKTHLVGPGKPYSEVSFGKATGSFSYSGVSFTTYEQQTITWNGPGFEVTAHLDGVGKRNSDGLWEVIECKSAADYGFDDFKQKGPGDYLKQGHVCMAASNTRSIRYYYIRKSTGHLWDRLVDFDQSVLDAVSKEYVLAQGETIPEKPYQAIDETFRSKPTGRKVLYWACGYCPFVEKCWPEAKKEFKNGAFGVSKPVFVIT